MVLPGLLVRLLFGTDPICDCGTESERQRLSGAEQSGGNMQSKAPHGEGGTGRETETSE